MSDENKSGWEAIADPDEYIRSMRGHEVSAEQQAREILERMGVPGAQGKSAGDVVELANLIAELAALRAERDAMKPKRDIKAMVASLLDAGTSPNDLLDNVRDELQEAAEARGWSLFGDGEYRRDTVCSICGSWLAGICGHERDPRQEVIERAEYKRRITAGRPAEGE